MVSVVVHGAVVTDDVNSNILIIYIINCNSNAAQQIYSLIAFHDVAISGRYKVYLLKPL